MMAASPMQNAANPGGQGGQNSANKPGSWMSNYKTKICKNWQQGSCAYDAKCTFAHGEAELLQYTGGGQAAGGMNMANAQRFW